MKILFAPDYREFAPYQRQLSDALEDLGIELAYDAGYRRVLPVTRSVRKSGAEVLHLHWIEHLVHGPSDTFRKLRLLPDIRFATRRTPLVYTVHDLFPTCWPESRSTEWMMRGLMQSSCALILHSQGAKEAVVRRFQITDEQCHVIPHGDQASAYGKPLSREVARARLGFGAEKVCLAFGMILPNKGLAELARFWAEQKPEQVLAIVGNPQDPGYARQVNQIAAGAPNIDLRYGFQSDAQVNAWFSAADCAIINYTTIFTSGVACLARSWGLPVLLPKRLNTIDLGEPNPKVIRYESLETDFLSALNRAVSQGSDYASAEEYRRETSWANVAKQTLKVYSAVTSMA